MKTYDIINAGPKNRFTVNGRVVSNSGRQIQLQNLVRNELSTLDEARELVKMGAFDLLESIYGNVPDVLSQLCRTMLIPKPGCEFVVADFSAIEARVLAFLAGEEWVLDAFVRGEDIYCATASQMFGVPVVKHGENGELRQKGKIATLACGYGGGVGALAAMGALDMGLKEAELEEIISSWREANPDIVRFWWDLERAAIKAVKKQEESSVGKIGVEYYANTLWLVLPSGRKLAYLRPKIETNKFGRTSVTYDGLNAAGKMVRIETYGGKYAENCVAEGTLVATSRGAVPIEDIKNNDLIFDGVEFVHHDGLTAKGVKPVIEIGRLKMTADHKILTTQGWRKACESDYWDDGDPVTVLNTAEERPVFDILNCGDRHRFAVFDGDKIRIISNCTQATARDLLAEAMWRMEQAGLDIVLHVHDEVVLETPINTVSVEDVCKIMNQNPSWAEGLPLASDGYKGNYYFKS